MKKNLDIEIIQLFQGNINVIDGKKYKICLLWKNSHEILGGNKAGIRLFTNIRKHQKIRYFEECSHNNKS